MNVKDLISVSKPYTSSIDFQVKNPRTISWSAIGEVDTATAREFATAIMRKADALDYACIEVAPMEYWREDLLFEDAKLFCFSLNIDGKVGWRFPTLRECQTIRQQAPSSLLDRLIIRGWLYTSTEPFDEVDNYEFISARLYQYPESGPVTTYSFDEDEYDFEDLDTLRSVVPVRDRV